MKNFLRFAAVAVALALPAVGDQAYLITDEYQPARQVIIAVALLSRDVVRCC